MALLATALAAVALGLGALGSPAPLAASAAPPAPELPPAGVVRQTVATILAEPQYHPPPPSFSAIFWQHVADLLDRLLEWLFRPIGWLVDKLGSMGVRAPVAWGMVVCLLIVVLVLILLHMYHASAGAFGRRGRKRVAAGGILPPVHDLEGLLALARRAEAQGNYREAVRLLYQASLSRLDRLGLLRYDPTKTNWAYAADMASSGPLGAVFGRLTSIADRALYSPAPVTADHFSQADRFYGELQEGLA